MKNEKIKGRFKKIGMVLVCTGAIFLSLFSIFSTYRLRRMAIMIYEHPYTCLLYTSRCV